jgi:hypothetical protein
MTKSLAPYYLLVEIENPQASLLPRAAISRQLSTTP